MRVDRRQTLAAAMAAAVPLPAWSADVMPTYAAVALQLTARSVEPAPDRAAARAAILKHIDSLAAPVRSAKLFVEQYGGAPCRLAVLPEYLFTSYPGRISIAGFADKAAFAPDGPEYEALGRLAEGLGMFLAVNAYESDRHFPGLYFQASTVVAPSGEVVLRYRRLNSMFAPTPHDVWSKYLDTYGLDGVFPVARTEIGNLAAIASEEILYPEIARAHALRGAELFVHSSSEIGSPLDTPKHIARRARAFENLAYVVSANTAGISGTAMPLASADGNSAVIDFRGNVLAESNSGETFTAFADIDLGALRAARRKPGMTNFLARQRTALFAEVYAAETHQRADSLIKDNVVIAPERDHFRQTQDEVIERLAREGLI
jgi:predicted amidohydrolase